MAVDPIQLERTFARLAELQPEQRIDILRTLAETNVELASRVATLLDAHDSETLGLNNLSEESLKRFGEFDPSNLINTELGGWRLTNELGRGGMGVVYVAERTREGVRENAAIKLLSIPLFDAEASKRFINEAAVLARLNHPGICGLRDWGRSEHNWPYLVLDLIEGQPIDQYVSKVPLKRRIELIASVAEAVNSAHRQLVVHLDIKPENILIDQHGVPMLLDFGVSHILAEEGDGATATLNRWLTPDYASPEQLRGEPPSAAADIYSLGAVLYQVITEQRPFDLKKASLADALQIIEKGVQAPSQITKGLPRELDTIIAKAMHPDPAQRYSSAAALADDLHAHLAKRPVSAKPDSFGYRLKKLVQRNPIAAPATALSMLAITALAVLLAAQANTLREQRDVAEREATRASVATNILLDSISAADADGAYPAATTVDEMLNMAERRIDNAANDDPVLAADTLIQIGIVRMSLAQYDEAITLFQNALEILNQNPDARAQLRATAVAGISTSLRSSQNVVEARATLENEFELQNGNPHWIVWLESGTISALEGRLDQAEQAINKALPLIPDELLPKQGEAIGTLGYIYQLRGQTRRALEYYEQSNEIARIPPVDRGLLAANALNLANLFSMLGRTDEALEAAEESLQLRIEMFGERHVKTIPSHTIQLYVLLNAGRLDEAIEKGQHLLTLSRQLSRENTLDSAGIWGAIGIAADRKGDAKLALEAHQQQLEIRTQLQPENHPDIAVTRSNLASAMMAMGDYEDSLNLLMKAWQVHNQNAGDEPSRARAFAAVNIAYCQLNLGNHELALQWSEDALWDAERVLEPNQWLLGHFQNQKAEALFANNANEQAEELALSAERLYSSSDVPARPKSVKENLDLLVRIYQQRNDTERAAEFQQRLEVMDSA